MNSELPYVSTVKTMSLLLISEHRLEEKSEMITGLAEQLVKDQNFREDANLKPEAWKAMQAVYTLGKSGRGSLSAHFRVIKSLVISTRDHMIQVYAYNNGY